MNIKKAFTITAIALGVASMPVSASELVDGYTKTVSDTNWKTSTGDCWRTGASKSTVKDVNCGYAEPLKPAVLTEKLVVAETAASVTKTLNDIISIKAVVLFKFDSAQLSADGEAVLAERIAAYKGHVTSTVPVKITGHTDSTGSEAYNQVLSEKRAASVADYIKNNTFLANNEIQIQGMGEMKPVMDNDTKLGRSGNRRVDIHFIGKEK